MKHFINLILVWILSNSLVFAQGDPAARLKGLKQSTFSTGATISVPNNQVTKTSGIGVNLETGNMNLLANPSFEHATYDTGWTCTGDSVESKETTIVIDGNASLETDATADTFECYQDTTLYQAQLSSVQGQASVWIKTNDVTVQVCARQAGVTLTGANCVTVNANNEWKEYIVPFVMGTTSNGISIKGTSGTGTTYIDNAYVGIMPANRIPDIQNITQWTDYGAMTITGTTTNPTKATTRQEDKVRCREVGQDYECEYRLSQTSGAGGAAGSGGYIFHLPSGIEFDSTIATMANKAYTGALTNAQGADVDLTRMGMGYGFVATASTANSPSPGRVVPTSSTTFQVFPLNNLTDLRQVSSGSYPLSDNNLAYFFSLKFRGKNLGSKSKVYSGSTIYPHAQLWGTVSYTGIVNCRWSLTNTAFTNYSADTDCNNPTATGKINAPSTKIPAFVLPSGSPVGTYKIIARAAFGGGATGGRVNYYRFSDGTNVTTSGQVYQSNSIPLQSEISGQLTYSSTISSDLTIQIQAAVSSGATEIVADDTRSALTFEVYYLPPTDNPIIGTFANVVTAPNIAKPKTCYYAFGGASATLASPTECTGTCVEVYDSCSAGTPPTNGSTARYDNLTFANGTWKASTPIMCKCTAYDTTANSSRTCNQSFDTGDGSWSTNANGGYVWNAYVESGATQLTAYVIVECTADAP